MIEEIITDVAPDTTSAVPRVTRYRRAPHLALVWEDGALRCIAATTGASWRVSVEIVRLLDEAGAPRTVAELSSRARIGQSLVRRALEAGLLEPDGVEHQAPLRYWNTFELVVQRRLGRGRKRSSLDRRHVPLPLLNVPGPRISLRPPAELRSDQPPFGEVLRSRRSRRSFRPVPLSYSELSELLMCAAGLQQVDERSGTTRRPYPSGGARHSLELYVAAMHVADLPIGCYYFDPTGSLIPLPKQDVFVRKLEAALMREIAEFGVSPVHPPAAAILITSVFERTFWKYQDLGLTLVHKDVGCLYQTLYLQVTAQRLGGFALGGGPEATFARQLGLSPLRQSYVGAFVIGVPRDPQGEGDGNAEGGH